MKSFERDHVRHLRGPSDAIARVLDFFRLTPNIITLTGLILTIPMAIALATGHLTLGLILFGISALTDFCDGALARYQDAPMHAVDRANQALKPMLFRRGKTEEGNLSGAALDPLTDKVRYFFALFAIGLGIIWWPLLIPGCVFAVVLTVLRIVYGKGKANMYGKYKAATEIAVIAALGLSALGVPYLYWPANLLLIAATILGGLSLGGQIYSHRQKRKNASS